MQTQTANVVSFPTPTEAKADRTFTKRWGNKPDLFGKGYLPLPTNFLELYSSLNITNSEAMFLLHLMDHKWDDKHPFPSYKTLAKRMSCSDKMARNHAASLETKKLLLRLPRIGRPNRFDLSPLFTALQSATEKAAALKAKKKGEKVVGTPQPSVT